MSPVFVPAGDLDVPAGFSKTGDTLLSLLNLSVPNMVFETSEGSIIRPITDHPPIIQNTLWGAFATMNILNPGSSFAPVAQINGIKNLPADGQMQMELMAEYIISLFNQGIVLLALQEVPPPNSLNAAYLTNKLKKSKLKIETFNSHWLQTGLHRFGTSLAASHGEPKARASSPW